LRREHYEALNFFGMAGLFEKGLPGACEIDHAADGPKIALLVVILKRPSLGCTKGPHTTGALDFRAQSEVVRDVEVN
jgi:hypothetical protein